MSLGRDRASMNAVIRLTKRKSIHPTKKPHFNHGPAQSRATTNPEFQASNRKPIDHSKQAHTSQSSTSRTPDTLPIGKFADLKASELSYEPLEVPGQAPVPGLANKLDRVLFSPGVHFLKDPRTNVYNFDPRLEEIMSITDFDFTKIAPYVPAGRDSALSELAQKNGKKYTGSTSSLTPALTQLHHAISHMRPPQTLSLPKYFPSKLTTFSAAQRSPTAMWLIRNANTDTYAVNAAGEAHELILTLLGQCMETMLVTESNEFAKYSKHHPEAPPPQPEGSTYNYTQCGQFLMRSQLDCHDPRLPGTGMFDLKTRACCAIRHDIDYAQIMDGSDYQILKLSGEYESFSREFYELVRSAMFKYSLQARIGRMDGIFVAYHNVRQLFGFEYLPLSEIDKIYHTAQLVPRQGTKPVFHSLEHVDLERRLDRVASLIADSEFKLSVTLLSRIFDSLHSNIPGSGDTDLNILLHCDAPGSLVLFARKGDAIRHPEDNLLNQRVSEVGLPEDAYGFRILLRSSVNGRNVPTTLYPSISSKEDVWRVSASITQMPYEEASSTFKKTLAQYIAQEMTSEPRTEDQPDEQELARMLAKLPEASDMQALLRQFNKLGSEYRQWDDKRPKITL